MLDEERNAILTFVEDTSPGVHDTVIAACDKFRYAAARRSARPPLVLPNFAEALAELSVTRNAPVPAPLNLFMNIPWDLDGKIAFEPTVSAPGDSVVFRAEVDVIVVASACPQDIVPINGPAVARRSMSNWSARPDRTLDVDHHIGVDRTEDAELTGGGRRHDGAIGDDRT